MGLLPKAVAIGMVLIGILYAGGCLYLYVRQRQMVFAPVRTLSATPDLQGLDYDTLWISLWPDAENALHGWWIPAPSGMPGQGVALLLHGQACTIGDNIRRAARLHQLGFSVLLADYRGYGLSEGPFPNEQRVYEDAEAMWRYLTAERDISPASIMIYGHSLGGAIAVELASYHPDAACLVVESSFTTIEAMAAQKPHLRLFPTHWLITQRFDSLSKVRRASADPQRRLPMPKLFAHGELDDIVPCAMGRALYQAASEPKAILIVPEANHETVADASRATYTAALSALSRLASPAASDP